MYLYIFPHTITHADKMKSHLESFANKKYLIYPDEEATTMSECEATLLEVPIMATRCWLHSFDTQLLVGFSHSVFHFTSEAFFF